MDTQIITILEITYISFVPKLTLYKHIHNHYVSLIDHNFKIIIIIIIIELNGEKTTVWNTIL